ncbi:hypothetical protein RJ639_040633 [Escallonia herrerae]|uniref:VQ domain-containing protein n=1 Tax=Escallonia herrerae TaxID=1293975 RepID=A0AA88WDP0_9ASTE|nr:hypothetical protein RJ639_040633 [Escallonia herrerae]
MKNKSSSMRSRSSRKKEELKVVYISSPMKLKTSASRFRALVQELTGRDSDVSNSRFSHMVDGGCSEFVHEDHISGVALREEDRTRESPASSESALDQDVFGSSMVDRWDRMFDSNTFFESSPHFDVLGSYDALANCT